VITLADYWMGRDVRFPLAMSPQLERNALLTVELANKLLVLAKSAGLPIENNPKTHTVVSSGWRPPDVNAATPGAAPKSKHITGEAIDLYDAEGNLDEWLLLNLQVLRAFGLWQEHPRAITSWTQVQTKPPRSGNRVFYP